MAKILVIDDDEIVREMIVQLLSEAGYESEGAHNGRHGILLLGTKQFDLIITDIVMPEKEGLETIIEIRKLNKTLPIIAISGGGKINAEDYLILAKNFGALHTFKKPIDTGLFMEAVRVCVSRPEAAL